MSTIHHPLARREWGTPLTQNYRQARTDTHLAQGLADNHVETVHSLLPMRSVYSFCRNDTMLAIVSETSPEDKSLRLALWSLQWMKPLWEIPLDEAYDALNLHACQVSDEGVILLIQKTNKIATIFFQGKETARLPDHAWDYLTPIGKTIVSCSDTYSYTEWDIAANPLWGLWLDKLFEQPESENESRYSWTHSYQCSDTYWIRLSSCQSAEKQPTIEIVHRKHKTKRVAHLNQRPCPTTLQASCLKGDQLFFARSRSQQVTPPAIGAPNNFSHLSLMGIDLVKQEINLTMDSAEWNGQIKEIQATDHYVAWVNSSPRVATDFIVILDRNTKQMLPVSIPAPSYSIHNVPFSLVQSSIVSYHLEWGTNALPDGTPIWQPATWVRTVVDLTSSRLTMERSPHIIGDLVSIFKDKILICRPNPSNPKLLLKVFAPKR
ncbi:MAG: hypothetical protein S4CHLAM102_04370 [Chlamydiia bacterium]|nr:hypothetical protein [Chlamydiia bacterium]